MCGKWLLTWLREVTFRALEEQHELFGRGSATAMGSLEGAEVGVPKAGRGSGERGCGCDRKMPSKKAV